MPRFYADSDDSDNGTYFDDSYFPALEIYLFAIVSLTQMSNVIMKKIHTIGLYCLQITARYR